MTFFLATVLVLTILWLLRELIRGRKKSLRQQWKLYGFLALAAVILLAVTKKWHVLSLLAAAVIPIIRQVAPFAIRFGPFLHQQFQRYRFQKPPPGQPSSGRNANSTANANENAAVTTELFHMLLNPNTGEITGSVRQGHFAGQTLESLDIDALIKLYREAEQHQDDSLAVFEAFLQTKLGPEWRHKLFDKQQGAHKPASSNVPLSTDEAWAILGLQPGAAKTDIIARHKSLIQKLHPDRGGSNYLTVRINQARDLLLKKTT